MLILIAIIALVLIILWSVYLPFYRERTIDLESDESKCFAPECRSIVIDNNKDKAILFIHGFPTTPYMYSYVTEYSASFGYDIYSPLIPTFGADYKEMQKTNFSSWFAFIDKYYLSLKERYKDIYVVGVSMGGAMTLKLAEKYSSTKNAMTKVAVISAPVVYNSIKDGIVTEPLAYFARIIKVFLPSIGAKPVAHMEGHNDGDENWHGYRGIFIKQGVSLIYSLKTIRKELNKIKVPMIAIHDKGDKTVPFGNLAIIQRETDTESLFIETEIGTGMIHSHHALLTYESTRKNLMDRILLFFSE